MKGNRGRDTTPEITLRSILHRQGLRFRKHQRPLATLRCDADIVFARERVAVFIDGCFWHGCPAHGRSPKRNGEYWGAKIARNKARDARNNRALADAGWRVIRVWGHEDMEAVALDVRQAVLSRRARPGEEGAVARGAAPAEPGSASDVRHRIGPGSVSPAA